MLEKEVINSKKQPLLGLTQNQSEEKLENILTKEFLTFTAGGQVVKRFHKMERPNLKHL
jgi:uncharacterized protein YceH (UPF0502 family)